MDIHSLPIARPDETLYSVAARIRLANATKNDLHACQSLFGPSRNMRVSDFPVSLVQFCAVTKDCFGDPARVLHDMTLAGFFERLGSRPWNAGSAPAPIITAGYGLATLSNGSVGRWRICTRCIESDLACHATAFWRRAHHLPTTFLCVTHDTSLAACIIAPLERHKRFFLPEQTETGAAIAHMDWTGNHQALVRLSALGIDVLEDKRLPVNARTVRAALLNALGNRGLLTASGRLCPVQFTAQFSQRYHFLRQHPDFQVALSPRGIDILLRHFNNPDAVRSATHNLLLIDWLFGTWNAFHQHCIWQATMDGVAYPAKVDHDGKWHRKVCLDFLEIHASVNRNQFARAAPRSFRWLLNHDAQWFNICLPHVRSMPTQGSLF